MISQRERGLYQVFSATVICAAVALFILVYLSQSLLREGWYSAPDAYLQCLIVLVLGLLLEAATRSETHRINSGQCSRRIAMSLASRQTIWLSVPSSRSNRSTCSQKDCAVGVSGRTR